MPDYPEHILPLEGWPQPLSTGQLLAICPGAIIARRFEGTPHECVETQLGKEVIKISKLNYKQMPNLSTSLIGAVHLVTDFHYRQTGNGEKPWEGETILMGDYEPDKDYTFHSGDLTVIGWRVSLIHQLPLPYRKVLPKQSDFEKLKDALKSADAIEVTTDSRRKEERQKIYLEAFKDLATDANKNKYVKLEGKAMVNHAPTKLNYWHYTIDEYTEDNPTTPIKDANNRQRELLCVALLDILRRKFILLPPVPEDANFQWPPKAM